MSQELPIRFTPDPAPESIARLASRLVAFNRSRVPEWNYRAVLFSLEDGAGGLLGGLYGHMSYAWLVVEALWVREQERSCGYDRRLLAKAEEQARQDGCHAVWLDTFSFQARGFYEKCGYTVFGELPNYPGDHHRYFLWKKLT
jgi:GNAT superfamily N-acetyltransferase